METGVKVHIGEVKTGSGSGELQTILGSCVGIGFLWPRQERYGLAHCLLPQAPQGAPLSGGRYVDQAIDTLFALMSITQPRDVRAVVAGGANMTAPDGTDPHKLVGYLNRQAAIARLADLHVRVIHEDTGGTEGRKMVINCATGAFDVRVIPRLAA